MGFVPGFICRISDFKVIITMLYLVLLWWFEQWEFRSNCENYFCSTGIFFRSGSFCRRKCFLPQQQFFPQEVLFLVHFQYCFNISVPFDMSTSILSATSINVPLDVSTFIVYSEGIFSHIFCSVSIVNAAITGSFVF